MDSGLAGLQLYSTYSNEQIKILTASSQGSDGNTEEMASWIGTGRGIARYSERHHLNMTREFKVQADKDHKGRNIDV